MALLGLSGDSIRSEIAVIIEGGSASSANPLLGLRRRSSLQFGKFLEQAVENFGAHVAARNKGLAASIQCNKRSVGQLSATVLGESL